MTDSTPDINTADDSDNILDGSMLVNSEPSSQSIGILTRILTLLNSGIVGKRLIGISALTLILLGSMKLYNFCLEINQEKLKNKHKIQEISKLVAKESRSDLIIDGLKSIMIKVNEINKSCSRYDHELKLLKKAKSSSEQVFIYLSTETYIPMTQSYSEYEKLKSEIRKLKGQMLSCRNFFK